MSDKLHLLLPFVILSAPLQAQQPEPFDRLTRHLEQVVAADKSAGVVALVMQHGEVVYQGAVGMADREANRPMQLNSLFRIASQTKAITSVAVMMLVEEGVLALSDPAGSFLPELASTTVSVESDSAGVQVRRVVPGSRAITIRDLLTHTAGMSYGREPWLAEEYAAQGLGPEAGQGWYFAHKEIGICDAVAPLGDLPLAAQPGERFVYGYATDVLGCIVERASGIAFDRFVRERITQPLGMDDSSFCVDEANAERLTAVYALRANGLTRAIDGPLGQGDYLDGPCKAFAGGAGLVSTAADYANFLEMLRRGGTYRGHRFLSPATVSLMTTDQLGDVIGGDVFGFGLGFQVWHKPAEAGRYGSTSQYGWGGAYHTTYWVDPDYGLVAVMMTQLMPATGSTLRDRYRTLVYQGLDGR